jgi:hypothetical protein
MDKPANIARDEAYYERVKHERNAAHDARDPADAFAERLMDNPAPPDPHGLIGAIEDLIDDMNPDESISPGGGSPR